jgi:hypothetical protein
VSSAVGAESETWRFLQEELPRIESAPTEGFSLWQLKRRFIDDPYQEQQNHSDQRWQKKLDQYRAAA